MGGRTPAAAVFPAIAVEATGLDVGDWSREGPKKGWGRLVGCQERRRQEEIAPERYAAVVAGP